MKLKCDRVLRRRPLPSIEEAWNLPISAEMNSRQQQQQTGMQGGLPGGQMSLQQPMVHQRPGQSFQKYAGGGQQAGFPQQNGPPPPYPQQQLMQANKRFKSEDGAPQQPQPQQQQQPQRPNIFITQQEVQMMQQLQGLPNLNQSQHNLLQQLQHRFRLQQQQLRQQQQQRQQQPQAQPQQRQQFAAGQQQGPAAAVAQFRNGGSFQQQPQAQQQFPSYATTASTRSDSTFQQQQQPQQVQNQQFSPAQPQQSAALPTINRDEHPHVSEQDLQAILSQKDLTASLAEDLLKQLSPGEDLSSFIDPKPTNGTPPPNATQQDVKPSEAMLAASLKQEPGLQQPIMVPQASSSSVRSPHVQTPPIRVKTPEIRVRSALSIGGYF